MTPIHPIVVRSAGARHRAGLLTLALAAAIGCHDDSLAPATPDQSTPPALASVAAAPSFSRMSASEDHSCAVTPAGRAYCWGRNEFGELGNGFVSPRELTPVPVLTDLTFSTVDAGPFSSCGLTTEQRAWCWGHNGTGRLGDGTTTNRHTPRDVIGGLQFVALTVSSGHTCGITTAKRAYCWGDNDFGELGERTTTERHQPTPVAGGLLFRQISAGSTLGSSHTCGVTTDFIAYCWGRNDLGQLGDGTTAQRLAPVKVAGNHKFLQVRAAEVHTCGLTTAHEVYCWGENRFGQLGDATTKQALRPVKVAGAIHFNQIATGGGSRSGNVGFAFTCGLSAIHVLWCWGSNDQGQLGGVTGDHRVWPARVKSRLLFRQVATGGGHACAATTEFIGYCWGRNNFGQLGDGTTNRPLFPVRVE